MGFAAGRYSIAQSDPGDLWRAESPTLGISGLQGPHEYCIIGVIAFRKCAALATSTWSDPINTILIM
jgi:hypothetical protein